MKKLLALILTILSLGMMSCAATHGGKQSTGASAQLSQTEPARVMPLPAAAEQTDSAAERGPGVSLLEAIEQSAERIAGELPQGSRVVIAMFESENDNLSDFIMEELTGALIDRGIEVADRQNLGYLEREFNFQMSGSVSDQDVKRVGQFLAANMVITGQLLNLGNTYRYRANATHLEQATHNSVTRFSVRNDAEMRSLVASLANQRTAARSANYGVSEQRTPQTAGTFLDRGILFLEREDYDIAIADFTEALRLAPDMEAAYFYRGNAYYRKDDLDRAIADYTQAIRLNPNDAAAYNNRGNAYANKGDLDRAIADYNQAIRLDPNYADAYYNRGNAYRQKGDLDRAIADFTQAIRLNPNHANAYYNRGMAYGIKGDYDRAITDFEATLRIDPTHIAARQSLELVRQWRGR